MGCRSTKDVSDAAEHAHKEIPKTWSDLEDQTALQQTAEAQDGGGRDHLKMDSDMIRKILRMMGASREQTTFFDVWAKHVHDPAVDVAIPGTGQQVFIGADLRFLEVRVTGAAEAMQTLLGRFVENVKDLPRKSLDELKMVHECLQADMKDPEITVWVKFKHVRSDAPPPSVDCGYLLNQDLRWCEIDVMMPSHEDQDALRDYALGEKHVPVLYGCSILPVAPERQLGFALRESASQNTRQILLTAFFFFKALGLMKPEDRSVRILNSCESENLVVCVGIGPEGLVRMGLSLIAPRNQTAAKELAEELAFAYREKELNEIMRMMGGQPDIIDYVGETKGYGIRLGFTA